MIYRSYPALFRSAVTCGFQTDSRLGPTRELVSQTLSVPAGIIVDRPRMNLGLGFAEALMLLAGEFRPDVLRAVAPKANHDLFTGAAAYGPRLRDQLPQLIDELRTDPHTRRAVAYLATPGEGVDERPCTNSIQFHRRNQFVSAIVSMRSWDLWLGLPYDLMMFGLLVQAVAACVPNTKPGSIIVTAGSAHVYEQHWTRRPGDVDRRFFLNLGDATEWSSLVSLASRQLDTVPWPMGVPTAVIVRAANHLEIVS